MFIQDRFSDFLVEKVFLSLFVLINDERGRMKRQLLKKMRLRFID
jgi:hypothetical protein